jgi:hypothetical protein
MWLWLLSGCTSPAVDPQEEPSKPEESSKQEQSAKPADDEMTDSDEPEPEVVPGDTKIEMRDVELDQPGGLTRVRYLNGRLKTTHPGRPPAIDNPKGYSILVEQAEVAVDWHTLARMMSQPKDGEKPPLTDAKFSETEDGLLVIESALPVPFRMRSEVGVDPEGRLTIKLVTLEALGVGTGLVRSVLGIKLEDIVKKGDGLVVDGDTIHLDPLVNSPPPKVIGKVIGASVEKDGLVLRLGARGVEVPKEVASTSVATSAEGPKANYLRFLGGTIIAGNVTMRHTDLRLMDQDPGDPFRLLNDTKPQIQAGYLKQLEGGKVEIHMPDANDLETAKGSP